MHDLRLYVVPQLQGKCGEKQRERDLFHVQAMPYWRTAIGHLAELLQAEPARALVLQRSVAVLSHLGTDAK